MPDPNRETYTRREVAWIVAFFVFFAFVVSACAGLIRTRAC